MPIVLSISIQRRVRFNLTIDLSQIAGCKLCCWLAVHFIAYYISCEINNFGSEDFSVSRITCVGKLFDHKVLP